VKVATGTYEQAFWIALGVNVVGFVFAAIFRTLDNRARAAVQAPAKAVPTR